MDVVERIGRHGDHRARAARDRDGKKLLCPQDYVCHFELPSRKIEEWEAPLSTTWFAVYGRMAAKQPIRKPVTWGNMESAPAYDAIGVPDGAPAATTSPF